MGFAKILSARLQLLRKSCSALGTQQCRFDDLWMCQDCAEVLPDDLVHLLGRDHSGGAFFVAARLDNTIFAATEVVAVVVTGASRATETTKTTTDQATEQILMLRIVAAGKLVVVSQFGLNSLKIFLAHQWWNVGDGDPFLTRRN